MQIIKTFQESNPIDETPFVGIIFRQGEYHAILRATSRSFKTLKGAERFAKKFGY